jgi:hypothetical protein
LAVRYEIEARELLSTSSADFASLAEDIATGWLTIDGVSGSVTLRRIPVFLTLLDLTDHVIYRSAIRQGTYEVPIAGEDLSLQLEVGANSGISILGATVDGKETKLGASFGEHEAKAALMDLASFIVGADLPAYERSILAAHPFLRLTLHGKSN